MPEPSHENESQICILAQTGEVLERRIATRRGRFAEMLGERPRARILVEASTESEWVARCLEELGHDVVVADPNFAPMYATRTRKVKTDRRDAEGPSAAPATGALARAIPGTMLPGNVVAEVDQMSFAPYAFMKVDALR